LVGDLRGGGVGSAVDAGGGAFGRGRRHGGRVGIGDPSSLNGSGADDAVRD
jgi:hypothetical protein